MRQLLTFFLLVVLPFSCTIDKKKTNAVDDTFTSITYKHGAKLADMPISELVESLEIIPLDNRDEALVRPWEVVLSDNYIGLKQSYMESYKLFNKKGKYICDIGQPGEGPGEYSSIYSSFIDDKNERVYLVTHAAKKVLVYDFKGRFLPKECIPLPYEAPKAAFYLDSQKKQLLVLSLSFKDGGNDHPVCWIQDLKGNVIQSFFSESYQVTADYSNELHSTHNLKNYDVQFAQFYRTKQDTLYHYDTENNRLVPKFSVYNPDLEKRHNFFYTEFSRHYCAWVNVVQMGAYVDQDVKDSFYILVDKSAGSEKYVRFRNDYLGGIRMHFRQDKTYFQDGYLTMILEPSTLQELFEERLQESDITDADRKVIEDFNSRITENDNCIIMYGKLK